MKVGADPSCGGLRRIRGELSELCSHRVAAHTATLFKKFAQAVKIPDFDAFAFPAQGEITRPRCERRGQCLRRSVRFYEESVYQTHVIIDPVVFGRIDDAQLRTIQGNFGLYVISPCLFVEPNMVEASARPHKLTVIGCGEAFDVIADGEKPRSVTDGDHRHVVV